MNNSEKLSVFFQQLNQIKIIVENLREINDVNIIKNKNDILKIIDYIYSRINYSNLDLVSNNDLNYLNNQIFVSQNIHHHLNQYQQTQNHTYLLQFKESLRNILKYINQNLPLELSALGDISGIQSTLNEIYSKLKNKQSEIENFPEIFNQLLGETKSKQKEVEQKINGIINLLNQKEEEASRLLNAIGNRGVSFTYGRIAEYHKKQANIFRWISLGIMVFLVIYLICTLSFNIHQFDWKLILIRIISSAIFIYPAQYAASQSSKHRELENYNRKMELDLAAINPFIELLDESKKKEIKEKLVDRYFKPIEIEKNKDEVPPNVLDKITDMLVKSIKDKNKIN